MKLNTSFLSEKSDFHFATPLFYIANLIDKITPLILNASKMETLLLNHKIKKIKIDRPIYICGMARSGTTITLEMLSQHPDVAHHKYLHMPCPYIPYLWTNFAKRTNVFIQKIERLHKDGILVDRESPEALEEIIWGKFFKDYKLETHSNIFNESSSNRKFERFYLNHLKKLVYSQKSKRYVAKNNYNLTRMKYILSFIPDAKFLILIRNPVNHIASTIKQCKIITEMSIKNPRLRRMTEIIGHHEFDGQEKYYINVNNHNSIKKIRDLWDKKGDVRGWAIYWDSLYNFVANQLINNQKVKNATLVVRYEDLCEHPVESLDDIIDHVGLSPEKFEPIKKYYAKRLKKPTYYDFKFSEKELNSIYKLTGNTSQYFGYNKEMSQELMVEQVLQ